MHYSKNNEQSKGWFCLNAGFGIGPYPSYFPKYLLWKNNANDILVSGDGNQKHGKHIEFKDDHLFAPNDRDRGSDWFMSFADLEDPKQGFLVDDTLIIEAEVKLLGLVSTKSNIVLYPVGYRGGKGNSISIFLSQSSIPSDTKFVVKFILRVKDQNNGNHVRIEDNHLFAPNDNNWGCNRFLSFADLDDPKQGFLVDDTLIIEAEVTFLGLVLEES
ncbi:hypothetical protein LWI29_011528 [Acer saccharum]|uniref:MATH domain-containing protein n=1 Tax=Acer saccharum TaxID=4024 RepID=A0AA39SSN1_ACESA|nr:hypothetical protein LWI29_011528 [Acer saccharum]